MACAFTATELEGKGRGLVAGRDIRAGEVVLSEFPLLLTPSVAAAHSVCTNCLRMLNLPGPVACATCGLANFCSACCAQQAASSPAGHTPLICSYLSRAPWPSLTSEQQDQLYFLIQAFALRTAAASNADCAARYGALLALCGDAGDPGTAAVLLDCLRVAVGPQDFDKSGMTAGEVAALMKKEEMNSFGIMALHTSQEDRERIRGSGIYATASMLNHECLPNTARFDYFDTAPPGSNTGVQFRVLHDIPCGEEITLSYFPLTWTYKERQQRCSSQYGFTCSCPRCKEESQWSDDEEEEGGTMEEEGEHHHEHHDHHIHRHDDGDDDDDDMEDTMDASAAPDGSGVTPAPTSEGVDASYISLFLMKYCCDRDECYGTRAPKAGQPDSLECSVCGKTITEAEFLKELEA